MAGAVCPTHTRHAAHPWTCRPRGPTRGAPGHRGRGTQARTGTQGAAPGGLTLVSPRRIAIHARGLRDTQTRHGKDTHAGRGSSRRGATRRGPHTVWHARDPPARGRVVSSFHRATDTCARARAGRAVDGLRSPRCTSARRPRSGLCRSGHKHACALRLITPIALRGRRACHTYPRKAHGGPCAFRVRRTMEALLLRRKRWFCGHSALKSTSRSSSALVAMSPARLIAPSVAATPRASTAGLLSAPFTTISAPACPAET